MLVISEQPEKQGLPLKEGEFCSLQWIPPDPRYPLLRAPFAKISVSVHSRGGTGARGDGKQVSISRTGDPGGLSEVAQIFPLPSEILEEKVSSHFRVVLCRPGFK